MNAAEACPIGYQFQPVSVYYAPPSDGAAVGTTLQFDIVSLPYNFGMAASYIPGMCMLYIGPIQLCRPTYKPCLQHSRLYFWRDSNRWSLSPWSVTEEVNGEPGQCPLENCSSPAPPHPRNLLCNSPVGKSGYGQVDVILRMDIRGAYY